MSDLCKPLRDLRKELNRIKTNLRYHKKMHSIYKEKYKDAQSRLIYYKRKQYAIKRLKAISMPTE